MQAILAWERFCHYGNTNKLIMPEAVPWHWEQAAQNSLCQHYYCTVVLTVVLLLTSTTQGTVSKKPCGERPQLMPNPNLWPGFIWESAEWHVRKHAENHSNNSAAWPRQVLIPENIVRYCLIYRGFQLNSVQNNRILLRKSVAALVQINW